MSCSRTSRPTLSATIESWLESHGYVKEVSDFGNVTWTRPEWQGWWRYPPGHPRAGEASGDRRHPTDVLVGIVLAEERDA